MPLTSPLQPIDLQTILSYLTHSFSKYTFNQKLKIKEEIKMAGRKIVKIIISGEADELDNTLNQASTLEASVNEFFQLKNKFLDDLNKYFKDKQLNNNSHLENIVFGSTVQKTVDPKI